MSNEIEKVIELKAPPARVWHALTDHKEFGTWFRLALEKPFKVGETARGHVTFKGYEHMKVEATVTEMTPTTRFAYTWHPYPNDPAKDYSDEPQTLVEFTLAPLEGGGTRLRVRESGFDKIPAGRRAEAFRMNDGGWTAQMKNLADHVASHP